jgi:hypothetical protein
MTAADGLPVFFGLAGGLAIGSWALADRLRAIAHDRARDRLAAEEDDHDATRKALVEAKRRITELEARLPP